MMAQPFYHWTLEEDTKLAAAYQASTGPQMVFCREYGERTGRTVRAILNRIHFLGMTRKHTPALVRFEQLFAAFKKRGEPDENLSRDAFLTFLMDVYEDEVKTLDLLNEANRRLEEDAHGNQKANPE